MSATERAPRRQFTLSLRALMLVVLAVAAFLGWKVHRAAVQRRAVGRIEKSGGNVLYDFTFSGEYPYKNVDGPPVPAWLRRWVGDEYFQEVTHVSLYGDKVTDADLAPLVDCDHLLSLKLNGTTLHGAGLAYLERVPSLRELRLHETTLTDAGLAGLKPLVGLRRLEIRQKRIPWEKRNTEAYRKSIFELKHLSFNAIENELMRRRGLAVTDAGLAHLAGMTRLRELSLRSTGVTDDGLHLLDRMTELRKFTVIGAAITGAGFVHLKGKRDLRELNVPFTDVNDAGLAHLSTLTGLRKLGLTNTSVTDAGLEHVKPLVGLEELELQGLSDLTDAGLVHLKGLKNLRKLDLAATMVTDAGLAHLSGLSRLEELDLSVDEITDAGLTHLRGLSRLKTVSLARTKVGDEGNAALIAAVPGVKVSRQGQSLLILGSAREIKVMEASHKALERSAADLPKFDEALRAVPAPLPDTTATIPPPPGDKPGKDHAEPDRPEPR